MLVTEGFFLIIFNFFNQAGRKRKRAICLDETRGFPGQRFERKIRFGLVRKGADVVRIRRIGPIGR